MYVFMHACMYACMCGMYQGVRGFFFQSQGIVSEKKKTFIEEILRGFGGQHSQQGNLVGVWGTDFP